MLGTKTSKFHDSEFVLMIFLWFPCAFADDLRLNYSDAAREIQYMLESPRARSNPMKLNQTNSSPIKSHQAHHRSIGESIKHSLRLFCLFWWTLFGFMLHYLLNMANEGLGTYFMFRWNLFGTSKMFTKYIPFQPFFYVEIHRMKTALNNIIFHISTLWNFLFGSFGKDGRQKMMTIRLNRSPESWIWVQYLPENMEWFLWNI